MIVEDITLENLHLPETEESKRFFPEAREAAIDMANRSISFFMMPEPMQQLVIGAFVMGYIACETKKFKPW